MFAHRLGRDRHIDVDVIMSWPLSKLYEHMAFYHTESDQFKESQKKSDEPMSFEEIIRRMELEGAVFKDE